MKQNINSTGVKNGTYDNMPASDSAISFVWNISLKVWAMESFTRFHFFGGTFRCFLIFASDVCARVNTLWLFLLSNDSCNGGLVGLEMFSSKSCCDWAEEGRQSFVGVEGPTFKFWFDVPRTA